MSPENRYSLSLAQVTFWTILVRGADPEAANRAGKGVVGFATPLAVRDDTRKASIADWFLGEDINTKDRIDITRLQMVMITAGLILAYSQAIFAAVRDIPTQDILLAIRDTAVAIPSLPAVGATMALMLAASHAIYLIAKVTESNPNRDGKG